MNITKTIRENAKGIDATIVLPEANLDSRVSEACEYILKNKLSNDENFYVREALKH